MLGAEKSLSITNGDFLGRSMRIELQPALKISTIELPQAHSDIDVNDVLAESIDETITAMLSRTVLDALYDYLQRIHSISRDEIPYRLAALSTTLEKLFGAGANTMTRAIARKFYLKLGLEFTGNSSRTLLEYVDEAKMKLQVSSSRYVGKGDNLHAETPNLTPHFRAGGEPL